MLRIARVTALDFLRSNLFTHKLDKGLNTRLSKGRRQLHALDRQSAGMELRKELHKTSGFKVVPQKHIWAYEDAAPCARRNEAGGRTVCEKWARDRHLHGLPFDLEGPAVWIRVVRISNANVVREFRRM